MKTTIIALALLLASSVTFASSHMQDFSELDQDGDGMLSAEEVTEVEGVEFETADENQDGMLDMQEYKNAVADMGKQKQSSH